MSIDHSDQNSQPLSLSMPVSPGLFLSDDSNPLPNDAAPHLDTSDVPRQPETNDSMLAAQLRRAHGFVCCQWWARALYKFALRRAGAAEGALNSSSMPTFDDVVARAQADEDAKGHASVEEVQSTVAELCKLDDVAGSDRAAFRRRSLRLLLSKGFFDDKLAAELRGDVSGGLSDHRGDGPSYRPRKCPPVLVADPLQPPRVGKMVAVSIPHHRHPSIINTELVCAEPKKRKPILDDSRIVSHPQRATLHGMEDILIEEALHYTALIHLRRHLDRHKSLRGIPSFLNSTVYFLVQKDDETFDRLLVKTRTNPAVARFGCRIPGSIRLEEALTDRLRVVEDTRRSFREAALSLSLLAARAHWRDVCLAAVKKFSSRHMTEWYFLTEVYSGVTCTFPNAAKPELWHHLRHLVTSFGTVDVANAVENIVLAMLLGNRDLPLTLSGNTRRQQQHPSQECIMTCRSSCSVFVIPPTVMFAIQGAAAIFQLLRTAETLHPDGVDFVARFLRHVDPLDDAQHVAWLMADPCCSVNADLAQLGSIGQAIRTLVQLVEAMIAEERDATLAMLRCHSNVDYDVGRLRRSMISAFEADEGLSDQVLVELVVSQGESLIRPVRLWED